MKIHQLALALTVPLALAACGQNLPDAAASTAAGGETIVVTQGLAAPAPKAAAVLARPLSNLNSDFNGIVGSTSSVVVLDGCATADSETVKIKFTISSEQTSTATITYSSKYTYNGTGWTASEPLTIETPKRPSGTAAAHYERTVVIEKGAAAASGNSTVTVTPTVTVTSSPAGSKPLEVKSSATVQVSFSTCTVTTPVHTHVVPTITVPGDVTLEASSASGAAYVFSASGEDEDGNELAGTCDYASGHTFPLGTTTVTCGVADSHVPPLTASDSFDVTSAGSISSAQAMRRTVEMRTSTRPFSIKPMWLRWISRAQRTHSGSSPWRASGRTRALPTPGGPQAPVASSGDGPARPIADRNQAGARAASV